MENTMKTLETIYEVQRIRQVKKAVPKKLREMISGYDVITSPVCLAEFVQRLIGDEDREVFLVVGLNTKNKVVFVQRCHLGMLDASIVSPREIMKPLILANCASCIVAHNHPSTVLDPSEADIETTIRLKESGDILGITVLDHLIVSENEYLSFREKGYL